MKYNVGDRVEIRRGLVIGSIVGGDSYEDNMEILANDHNYILTIKGYNSDYATYKMLEDEYEYDWTEEMIEGLVEASTKKEKFKEELTDREKFEEWMGKLCSLEGSHKVHEALNELTYSTVDTEHYNYNLKTVADYLFSSEKKKMTKAEIETELGYEIEIVE